jgi:hypothetical protein
MTVQKSDERSLNYIHKHLSIKVLHFRGRLGRKTLFDLRSSCTALEGDV